MPILRHLDKAVFAILCVLAIGYGVSRIQHLRRSAENQAAVLAEARKLAVEVEGVEVPPPPKDPAKFTQAIRLQWGDMPWVVSLDSRHFYPAARPARD